MTPRAKPSQQLVAAVLALSLLATGCRVASDEMANDMAGPAAIALPDDSASATTPPSATSDPGVAGDVDSEPEPESEQAQEAPADVERPASPPTNLPRPLTSADLDCALPGDGNPSGLTTDGEAMFDRHAAAGTAVPRYELIVDINPETGGVSGAMRAAIPTRDAPTNFRVFAGMEAFDSQLAVDNVTLNGEPVDAVLDRALLTLPAPSSAAATSVIELDFSYTIAAMAANENIFGALSGETLQPDQVGLLGRTETGMQLGHWFPVWLPDGIRTDPDPSGFGDIGAFPTADICVTITVPASFQVVTGGVRMATTDTSVVEAARGLRDLSILISNDLGLRTAQVDGVEIRVWGPSDDPEALDIVLDYAEDSQIALVEALGPYPWQEIDLVSAPLGGGVGGMEWPGMIWVERSMFAGGLPGMGDLGELFGDGDVDLSGLLGGAGGEALSTTLEWTIAHELGHEWWHATVGNDSIESPAVDEPLAQFSACIAMQRIHPDNWRRICEAQTIDQYGQARGFGVPDTAAEQPSDSFNSALQYGAIVYGKAPGFYFAASDLMGWDELIAALRSFVDEHAFDLVSTDTLRDSLIVSAGTDGPAIAELWDRWFREAKGDEDIEIVPLLPGLGDLGELEDVLGDLEIEGLDELFGEDAELFEELLEDLLDPQGTN